MLHRQYYVNNYDYQQLYKEPRLCIVVAQFSCFFLVIPACIINYMVVVRYWNHADGGGGGGEIST